MQWETNKEYKINYCDNYITIDIYQRKKRITVLTELPHSLIDSVNNGEWHTPKGDVWNTYQMNRDFQYYDSLFWGQYKT